MVLIPLAYFCFFPFSDNNLLLGTFTILSASSSIFFFRASTLKDVNIFSILSVDLRRNVALVGSGVMYLFYIVSIDIARTCSIVSLVLSMSSYTPKFLDIK